MSSKVAPALAGGLREEHRLKPVPLGAQSEDAGPFAAATRG